MTVGLGGRSLQGAETISQPRRDVRRIERLDLSGGELYGQGQTVEVPADLGHGFAAVEPGEVRAGEVGTVAEQHDGVGLDVERRHRPDGFAGNRQRLAAGGQDAKVGCSGEQWRHHGCAGRDDVLAVVENEQGGWPRGEGVADHVKEFALRLARNRQHLGDGTNHLRLVGNRCQFDQPHPTRETR